jgi:hypothetical protein
MMATASKFTKVSVIQSLSLEEADTLIFFLEQVSQQKLTTAQSTLIVGIYQSLNKAMNNGRI